MKHKLGLNCKLCVILIEKVPVFRTSSSCLTDEKPRLSDLLERRISTIAFDVLDDHKPRVPHSGVSAIESGASSDSKR